ALQRLVSAFPSEIQNSVAAQLADCLAAVICQRLRYNEKLGIRLPECEILTPTHAVKNFIRRGDFHQITSVIETGADHGMWTFTRYRAWMANRRDWYVPAKDAVEPLGDLPAKTFVATRPVSSTPAPERKATVAPAKAAAPSAGRIEIEPDEGEFGKIL